MRYPNFAKWLSDVRANKELTQASMAKLAGYRGAQFISNAERGLCMLPFKTLSKIVDRVGGTRDSLQAALLKDQEVVIKAKMEKAFKTPSKKKKVVKKKAAK